jgi:hypothetical protein
LIDLESLPVVLSVWKPCWRLIASRYPTVSLYDDIADPADLDVVFAIEGLTNPRLREDLGQLHLVDPDDRISGPGATPIMAAFTHLNPEGSRFSDGQFGVYYAADSLATALAEVSHHRAVFLSRTKEPAIDLDLRVVQADLKAPLHDLRGLRETEPALYDPADYSAGRRLGTALRAAGSAGIRYWSVRHAGGQCAAVLRPRALGRARAGAHIALHWDGQRITHWYEKKAPKAL